MSRLLNHSRRRWTLKIPKKEGQRNEELIHIFRLTVFVTIENFFSDSWVLMSERKSPNKLHHISCQSYLDKARGSFDPVNLDKYLPLLPTDEEKPFLSECCQGIVNFELLISHLGSISHMGKAQPGWDEEGNLTDCLRDGHTHLVIGKSLLMSISRIPSFAASLIHKALNDCTNDSYEQFVMVIFSKLLETKLYPSGTNPYST